MDWPIDPLAGIGPLRFGMPQAEASVLFGEPDRTDAPADAFEEEALRAYFEGEIVEYRLPESGRNLPILTFKHGKLIEAEFYPEQTGLRLGDVSLFMTERTALIARLIDLDPDALADDRTFRSPRTGLSMAMPGSADENPSIVVTGRGRTILFDDEMMPARQVFESRDG